MDDLDSFDFDELTPEDLEILRRRLEAEDDEEEPLAEPS